MHILGFIIMNNLIVLGFKYNFSGTMLLPSKQRSVLTQKMDADFVV